MILPVLLGLVGLAVGLRIEDAEDRALRALEEAIEAGQDAKMASHDAALSLRTVMVAKARDEAKEDECADGPECRACDDGDGCPFVRGEP